MQQSLVIPLISAFAILTAGQFNDTQAASTPRSYALCASKYKKIDFTDAELDAVLAHSTSILSNAATDQAPCAGIAVTRQGAMTSLEDDAPNTVATESDFRKLTTSPCVKIVQRISWCDGPITAGGVLGCSPVPGLTMVVVHVYPDPHVDSKGVEPVTWLHELGHTLGMAHNDINQNDVMASVVTPENKKLTPDECHVYAGTPTGQQILAQAARPLLGDGQAQAARPRILPAEGSTNAAPGLSETNIPIQDFVKKPFGPKQFPDAEVYKGDVETAEKLLFDPAYQDYKNNIVGLLAVIGTPHSIPVLEKLIRTPIAGTAFGPDALARFAALTAIGTIANRYKLNDDSVSVLKSAQDPQFWQTVLKPQDPSKSKIDSDDIKSLSRDLTIQSLHGYALTGSKQAEDFLKEKKDQLTNTILPEPAKQDRKELLDEAIKLNSVSKNRGALSVFDR